MKRLAPLLLLLAPCIAGAADPAATGKVDATLEPGKFHEVCDRLEAGAQRRYHWKADQPVDFNIHYHRGAEVHFPVKREAMRGDGGTFTARSAEDYCWMWTARNARTRVTGSVGE